VWVRIPPSAPSSGHKVIVLEVSNLHLWRGDRHLLKGIALTLAAGQCVQLLWANGTGKTSLLRCLAGFLYAEEGSILWNGQPVKSNRDVFHDDLAYLGHETALKGDLTAAENLHFACALRTRQGASSVRAALGEVGLGKLDSDQTVRSMSAGQQRRVALARLKLWDAKLWLLDEPASNLDTAGQAVLTGMLLSHLGQGGMAILATHHPVELSGTDCRFWRMPQESI
jgi:heme exporter protein A